MNIVNLSLEDLRKAAVLRRLELAHLVTELDKITEKSLVQQQINDAATRLLRQSEPTAEEVYGLWQEFKETVLVTQKEVV